MFKPPALEEITSRLTLISQSFTTKKQMCFLTRAVDPSNFVSDTLMSVAPSTGCCLWVWSEVIACFVTFPCKWRLTALINFRGSQNRPVSRRLFDIALLSLSHSDKDNCFKLARGYWLLKMNRRAKQQEWWHSLKMTLQSANIKHPQPHCNDTSDNKCGLTLRILHSAKHETAQFRAS